MIGEDNKKGHPMDADIPVFTSGATQPAGEEYQTGMYNTTGDGVSSEDILAHPEQARGDFHDEPLPELEDQRARAEVVSDEDEARARTKKKQMMIKLIGVGVIVLFIGIALISSWMKAQKLKASQNQESAFDQTEEVKPQQNIAQQPIDVTPTPVNGIDLNNPATMAPMPASAIKPDPSLVAPTPVPAVQQPDVTQHPASAQPDTESRAQIDQLSARVATLEDALYKMKNSSTGLNYTDAKKPKGKTKSKVKVKPIVVLEDKPLKLSPKQTGSTGPTVPVSPSQVAEVVAPQQVVTKKDDPCDKWSVKGAVPGMAWLENDGKIVSVKIGDHLGNIGMVVSVDAVNFEVKTRSCAIR